MDTSDVTSHSKVDSDCNSDDSLSSVPEEIEELLSNELMRMPITNRNEIREEIHGVRCMAVEETPELIRESLTAFQRELDNDAAGGSIPPSKKKVYHKLLQKYRERSKVAAVSGSTYTNYAIDDKDFRLRFLRCELFDPSKAALRFCNYLDFAYEHFGEDTLERPVRITDFSRAEMKSFRKGYFQFLPFRDSSGRRVLVIVGGMGNHVNITLRDKICFYMFDVVTRDSVESQRKGFIIIRSFGSVAADKNIVTDQLMANSTDKINLNKMVDNMKRVLESTPSRLVAIHMDIPSHPPFRLLGKLMFLKVFGGSHFNLRSRLILGGGSGEMEHRYRMKSYGIPGSRLTSIENPGNRFFRDLIRTFLEEKEKETQKLRHRQEEVLARIKAKSSPDSEVYSVLIRRHSENVIHIPSDRASEGTACTSNKKAPKASTMPPSASALAFETTKAMATTSNSSSIGKKNTEKGFCDWLVVYIESNCNGRFLEWDKDTCGWVVMTEKMKIRRKVSITLYNWGKRLKTLAAAARLENSQATLSKKRTTTPAPHCYDATVNGNEISNTIYITSDYENNNGHNNDPASRFMDGREGLPSQQELGCCSTPILYRNNNNNNINNPNIYTNFEATTSNINKRARHGTNPLYPSWL
eukprot:jgi/Psemu1/322699/estExt_fgenesh1_pg.C_380029